jgi:hypothetical protein
MTYLEERLVLLWLGESRYSSTHAEHARWEIKSSKSLLGATLQPLQRTEYALSDQRQLLNSMKPFMMAFLTFGN